ncbi:MAG TPA: NAD-glutamate dehydrogenase [Thermoanaerobaculia bacterium]|nr:NAD-glutamate dehydrogenase [Thermoanaerobaculia bacterium]
MIQAEPLKSELIDQVAERVRALAPSDQAPVVERFARQLYADVPAEDLDTAPETLASVALELWAFAQERQPGTPKVRVYSHRTQNPSRLPGTVVEIVNDDMPFLVDSVASELMRLGAELRLVIHPILSVERDAAGRLTALHDEGGEGSGGGTGESFMHIRLGPQPAERHAEFQEQVQKVLADVRAAVADFRAMRQRCDELAGELEQSPPPLPPDEIAEGIEFLRWINDRNFVYLGYREYRFEGKGEAAVARVLPDTGLGLLRDEQFLIFDGLRNFGTLPAEVRHFLRQPVLLLVTKANRLSTVHRLAYMDTIAVKCFDDDGKVTGERLFIGLFTAEAYSISPRAIPFLRRKVENVLARADFAPGSYNRKTLAFILETYPRNELFQIGEDDLLRIATGILHLQERHRTALFVRRDPFGRFVSCLVYVPRDRFDTDLRSKLEAILARAYQGSVTASNVHLTDDSTLARLHVLVSTRPGQIPDVDTESLERDLAEASRSWADRLSEALIASRGEEEGLVLARRYGRAFPSSYQDRFDTGTAVFDVGCLEKALATGEIQLNLYRPAGAPPHEVRFKVYGSGDVVPLSNVLPMLENMGVKVLDEIPYDIQPAELDLKVWLRDFSMASEDRTAIDLDGVREAFHQAFAQVWRNEAEDDGFNRLVLRAVLSSREVSVLRAYAKYLRQAQIPFSQAYMERTLATHPAIARQLVDLFQARFDPSFGDAAGPRAQSVLEDIQERLDDVTNLDEDRILRRFLNLIEATLRTNFFQTGADGRAKGYLSLKLDSRRIEELPLPRPMFEVFVYSPRVEAVHLRGGKVARGGIRWSDRREDFRTEVLGLMKAQMVKNAVIVPVGSKGGFFVKQPPEGSREAVQAEGVRCYQTLVRGLLDITDNLRGSEVVPPPQVVRRDPPDPYLVVAADKGTATFSDIANALSAEYGFWLDDAFASGGSAGYDHKRMAITSRGVWESVKRHFREMNKDVQTTDFTVIGIGDMSGDVFGNGMLMSRHIRLLATFNHMHIFIDPNPDAEAGYRERERLFHLPRSTWADYDTKLISPGGGVFERKVKSIDVTPEMKQAFGLTADQATPNELIRALLRAPVELLFFGGIGTYVKARSESHADVGDRTNDALRVDGAELTAKVIGEGANLGMTQRGRVEYALRAGRLNTDFIDNSAGVDCSDHEVNIKVLLNDAERAGEIRRDERNELLKEMTEEVAELVLRDNYLQTQAITVTHRLGAHLLDRLARLMRALEKAGRLDRQIEALPDDESLAARAKQSVGFTRPELSVLLSYTKIALYDELLASDLPDDPAMQEELVCYFPTALRHRFAHRIGGHRLRREIVATSITNNIVNRAGVTFAYEVGEKTASPVTDVARAYMVSREVFGLRELWERIEALDNRAPAALQATMLLECGRLIERGTVWFLRESPRPLDIMGQIEAYSESVHDLVGRLESLLCDEDRALLARQAAAYIQEGAPEDLAHRIASLAWMVAICDIVRIAREAGVPAERVGQIYFDVGSRFGFDWLRRAAGQLPTDNVWDKQAVSAIVDDLLGYQRDLTVGVLSHARNGMPAGRAVEAWAEQRRPFIDRTEQLLAELRTVGAPDLAMLAVANRQLKSMRG